jgi:hypothetical protein
MRHWLSLCGQMVCPTRDATRTFSSDDGFPMQVKRSTW